MDRKHNHFAIVTVLLMSLTLSAPKHQADAQEDISLASLTIQVWPEYDQPSALVFYIGHVAEGTELPAVLRFQLPPGADLNATAYIDKQSGSLLTASSEVQNDIVTVNSPNGSFHIEFYDASLKVDGTQRTYSLVWQGDYPVTQLTLNVEQPVGAHDMIVEPAGGSWGIDNHGLQAYVASPGGLQAGQLMTLSVSYTKTGNTLTIDSLSSLSSDESSSTTTTPANNTGQIVGLTILIAVLVIVIGGVMFYFLRRGRSARRKTGKRFCTQCGHAIGTGDRFCRHCGTKLD